MPVIGKHSRHMWPAAPCESSTRVRSAALCTCVKLQHKRICTQAELASSSMLGIRPAGTCQIRGVTSADQRHAAQVPACSQVPPICADRWRFISITPTQFI